MTGCLDALFPRVKQKDASTQTDAWSVLAPEQILNPHQRRLTHVSPMHRLTRATSPIVGYITGVSQGVPIIAKEAPNGSQRQKPSAP